MAAMEGVRRAPGEPSGVVKVSISLLRSIVDGGPFAMNTLIVETNGTITRSAPRPVRFAFTVGGQAFEGLAERNDEGGELLVTGELCPMPFSAEDAEARRDLLHILRRCSSHVPGVRFSLNARQRVALEGTLAIPQPMSPRQLVGSAAKIVADAMPWIALLSEAAGRIQARRAGRSGFSVRH